jgi:RNA polymerase sigma-70 factor (ECF subfamily)
LPADRDDAPEVGAFLRGDRALVGAVRDGIRAVVDGFRFGGAAAEDLVQDAVARVFFSLRAGRFRGEASLATFARHVARVTCLEHLRRLRFRRRLGVDATAPVAADDGPAEHLLRAEEHRRNLRVLASLPAPCRQVFQLIFVEGLSYREIASRLGISENAVKARVHRCRLACLSAAGARRPARKPVRGKRPAPSPAGPPGG